MLTGGGRQPEDGERERRYDHPSGGGEMREFKLFINGEFCDAASGETYESIHPGTGEVVATVAKGGPDDVARACAAAQAAFDGEWGALSSAERAGILGTVACMIERDADELAELEMLDVGKPITEARAVDAPAAVNYLRWYADGWEGGE